MQISEDTRRSILVPGPCRATCAASLLFRSVGGWRGEACSDAPGTLLARILRFSRYLCVRSRHPGSADSESTRRTTARLTTPGAIVALWSAGLGDWGIVELPAARRAARACAVSMTFEIFGGV